MINEYLQDFSRAIKHSEKKWDEKQARERVENCAITFHIQFCMLFNHQEKITSFLRVIMSEEEFLI